MHSRGSGFFDFSYTTLTAGNLLIAVLFFSNPSKAQRIPALTIAVLLLVNMIIIVAVSRIRAEEGWVGITSVVWALLMAIWTVVTDRVVAWGKKEEEERLTGREETRRTLKEWLAVLIETILMVVLILVAVLLSATLILRARDASLPAPGEKYPVDGGKYEVHLYCHGKATKNPIVFLEGGESPVESGLVPFAKNAVANGTIDRFCYWDRPGLAFSDNAPSPFSASMAAVALSEALARAGEEGPWVLLSAGVGSVYSRVFAARQVLEVKGLMLVDPLQEDLLYRLAKPGRGFLLWARGVISPLGLDRLSGALFRGRTREDRVYGKSASQSGRYIKAKLQESLVADSLTKNDVVASKTILGREYPLVVVSSGIEVKRDDGWADGQKKASELSDKLLSWSLVRKAPHQVWETLEGRETMEKWLGELVKK